MKFWFVHSREVPLVDQIGTQVRMAVLAGDLAEGERLPSVRALARRYGLHHNTVSQAYQRLEEQGIVESRRGSGVFVRPANAALPAAPEGSVAAMLGNVIAFARAAGMSDDDLRAQFEARLTHHALDRILLVDPDPEFRAIACFELAAGLPDIHIEAEADAPSSLEGTLIVARPSQADGVRRMLPADTPFCALRIGSAAQSLMAHLPGPKGELLGLVSRWPTFLDIGRTMLLATGLDAEALIVRDAREPDWQHGLEQTWGVVCDSLIAPELPTGPRALVFRLLAEDCMEELRERLSAAL